jgi:type IV secretion system protein VirD4
VEDRTLSFLLSLLEKFGAEQETVNEIMVGSLDEKGYHQFRAFLSQEEKMMNSVLSTAKTALRSLHDPTVAELTARTTLDFGALRESPTAIFIQVAESELKYYNFFLSLLYTQLFKFVLNGDPLNKDLHPIFFLFDEAGHIKVPNLATIATTIRRRRCSLSLILQDLDQLRALYGQEANAIIRGGMVNQLYFGGLDIQTCELLERTLGKETVSYSESGYGSSLKPAQSRTTQMSRSLMFADEIRRMNGKAIFLSSNRPPALLKLKPWFRQRELVKRTKL